MLVLLGLSVWKFSLIKFTKNWNCSRTQLKKHFEKPVSSAAGCRRRSRSEECSLASPALPPLGIFITHVGTVWMFSFKNKPSSHRHVSKRE